jgi:hypothetical protein
MSRFQRAIHPRSVAAANSLSQPGRWWSKHLGDAVSGVAQIDPYLLHSVRCSTTRRLCARPSTVLLSATGLS